MAKDLTQWKMPPFAILLEMEAEKREENLVVRPWLILGGTSIKFKSILQKGGRDKNSIRSVWLIQG